MNITSFTYVLTTGEQVAVLSEHWTAAAVSLSDPATLTEARQMWPHTDDHDDLTALYAAHVVATG